MQKIEDSRLC